MRLFVSVATLVITLGPITVNTQAATFCTQEFTIYGKTAGDHSILMYEIYTGGECEDWTIHSLYLGFDSPKLIGGGTGATGKDWIPILLNDLPHDTRVELSDSNGAFYINDTTYFTPPQLDSTFKRKFMHIIREGGSDERDWYRACQSGCSDYPEFYGADAELIYVFRGGLYKNYTIKEAVHFPESGYLVIIIDQPLTATGMDTMHGMLVYRLHSKE
ncbi:MAG: hypothetical protein JW763_07215 [candidate division Zixibacteria bacterium]|nr:hypothetical protein [candidate division Zixibacteria bacterium]